MEEKLKYLMSASGFELERVRTALSDNGIPNDSTPKRRNYSAKAVTGVDDTEQDIYVAASDYEKAYDLCVGIGAITPEGEVEIIPPDGEETAADSPAEEEEMSPGKRTAVRIISAILFVLLAAAVIFGTDYFMQWIKGFFL